MLSLLLLSLSLSLVVVVVVVVVIVVVYLEKLRETEIKADCRLSSFKVNFMKINQKIKFIE